MIAAELPFKVKPFWFEPGLHARCIVLDSENRPPIGPDFVIPLNERTAELAVKWFFHMEELPVVHTALSRLQKIFGDDVTESGPFAPSEAARKLWEWPD